MAKKFKSEELDKLARLCAVQKGLYPEEGGLMFIRLRRLTDEEMAKTPGPRGLGDSVNAWEVDLPTTGTTYYGPTPEEAFRNALEGLVADYQEEMAKAHVLKEADRG